MAACLSLRCRKWRNVRTYYWASCIASNRLCIRAGKCIVECSCSLFSALWMYTTWKIFITAWIRCLCCSVSMGCSADHRPFGYLFFKFLLLVSYDWSRVDLLHHLLFCGFEPRCDLVREVSGEGSVLIQTFWYVELFGIVSKYTLNIKVYLFRPLFVFLIHCSKPLFFSCIILLVSELSPP